MRSPIHLARPLLAAGSIAIAAACGATVPASRPQQPAVRQGEGLARETLAPNDGWAAFSTGTTGGAAAAEADVFVVTNRKELVTALDVPRPKIVLVSGTIDANVDDANRPLACGGYADPGYTLDAYLAAYDPATWGRTVRPNGPLEDARKASQARQQARVRIRVPSNTTIAGLDAGATIQGGNLYLANVDNVIIRDLTLRDAYDCFAQWDPTDGALGNWNSEYDNISITGATHVWVDHCAFDDGSRPDSTQPLYFGRPYQWHDGELDITNQADLVTVSWNRFTDHDKVMLIGSSDTSVADRDRLRVTLHHNLFARVVQRAPRVRFGRVHVYNNSYVIRDDDRWGYSWGAGVESKIYAENNGFHMEREMAADRIIKWFGGSVIYVGATSANGLAGTQNVDVLAAYNAAYDPDLSPDVGWQPTLVGRVDPADAVPALVEQHAGPFREQAAGQLRARSR